MSQSQQVNVTDLDVVQLARRTSEGSSRRENHPRALDKLSRYLVQKTREQALKHYSSKVEYIRTNVDTLEDAIIEAAGASCVLKCPSGHLWPRKQTSTPEVATHPAEQQHRMRDHGWAANSKPTGAIPALRSGAGDILASFFSCQLNYPFMQLSDPRWSP
ncbi:hypothetical protein C8J57DRAFT_1216844 [Mycena rebaudengoi]|nr:hypothetical protein C8J57DRAFT_1216844 [Mycena rebaudengoi]